MENERDTGLPASIEAAWGLRGRPTKGPKRGLSLERIVEAAVNVADADGLAAVSMSRVATELGASTMSLYRYVSAKDELLALMVDAAYGPPPEPVRPDEGWRDGLERWARAELAGLRRHPWVVRVPISGPPLTPNSTAWLEVALRALRGTRLTGQQKMSVILLITSFVRSWAALVADIAEAAQAAGATPDDAMAGYGRALAGLIDPARFPELSEVIAAGALDDEDEPEDGEFLFGLERILDGIDVLVRARG
ncbi:TetR/AcrR family transcriptional regulator [Planosporangium thailandense]|uniref:TetR/AcrR family transcriptional regulator n=1 Tax=Planosporangium thailandense TaxID=765197 RepID=A0ABX0Y7B6_9ACTN|nr:TetR/AcrR family transcriptional regulator [Planosporangium thailandense]NJC73174.1 TetR/AcrR family transcriptional regulator [Planosporangium thailandense]